MLLTYQDMFPYVSDHLYTSEINGLARNVSLVTAVKNYVFGLDSTIGL